MKPTPWILARRTRRAQTLPFDLSTVLAKDSFDFALTRTTHLALEEQRLYLHYLRLEESLFPHLVSLRQKFHPPTPSENKLVQVRKQFYLAGDDTEHPSAARVSITFDPSHPALGLTPPQLHKFKLLAGPRWRPDTAPVPSPSSSSSSKHATSSPAPQQPGGTVKISCELFDNPEMNEKWCSDTLDKLVQECKTEAKGQDTFQDVPFVPAQPSKTQRKKRRAAAKNSSPYPTEWLPPSSLTV